jgi:hypothetical protein
MYNSCHIFLSLSFSLSLSFTHTQTHTHTHIHKHTHFLSLSFPLTHIFSLTHFISLSHTFSLTHSHIHFLSLYVWYVLFLLFSLSPRLSIVYLSPCVCLSVFPSVGTLFSSLLVFLSYPLSFIFSCLCSSHPLISVSLSPYILSSSFIFSLILELELKLELLCNCLRMPN